MDEVHMGISRIGSLFAANVDSLANRSKSSESSQQPQTQTQGANTTSSEAVVFSASLGRSAQAQSSPTPPPDDRAARVQQLRDQVARGEYKPSSQAVAVSVFRDLA
jgi:flagellar biosynthesis anti-sigma factor FlgM